MLSSQLGSAGKIVLAILLLLGSIGTTKSHDGMDSHMIEVKNWVVPFNGPKDTLTATVGDTIKFTWTGMHDVHIHPTMNCDLDERKEVGLGLGSGPIHSAEYTFVEEDGSPEGNRIFFSCDIGRGAHCRYGT